MPERPARPTFTALVAAALLVVGTLTAPRAGALPAPRGTRFSSGSDAIAFLATTTGEGIVFRNGTKVPYNGFKAVGTRSFSGQFDATNGGDVFIYNPGSAADGILHTAQSGASVVTSFTPLQVTGTYTPIVGDFDGNLISDILWYAPGPAPDTMWHFNADGSHTSTPITVNGTYRPIVVDANGDGRSDILWYGPGKASDMLWLMDAAGGHTSQVVRIDGNYQAVVGPFGNPAPGTVRDRIVFYNPAGADYLWTFDTAGTPTAHRLPNIDGAYQLLPGQFVPGAYGSIFLYGPGSLRERIWSWGPAVDDPSVVPADQVTGRYLPQTGDFDDNGLTDIVWTSPGSAQIWKTSASSSDHPVKTTVTGIPGYSLARAIEMD